ncbi:MAG: sulfite exporter TauE/SafE family protein [Terracidiphilus sp.]
MAYFIGFFIALFIALTGVGAGTLTVPVLILFLGVPAADAVAIGLMFSSAVKSILLPVQLVRRTIAWRTLGWMALGGAPGVLAGSLFLRRLVTAGAENQLRALLGAILVATATWQILFSFRPLRPGGKRRDRSRWLPWLMLPVGAEVGFSSAGAGALGSAALLGLTPLEPAQVVGTDIAFGFLLSLLGAGAHWFSFAQSPALLLRLIAGGVLGAVAGTELSARVPRRPLRFALWVCLLILGGGFLLGSYQVWAATR